MEVIRLSGDSSSETRDGRFINTSGWCPVVSESCWEHLKLPKISYLLRENVREEIHHDRRRKLDDYYLLSHRNLLQSQKYK